MKKNVVLILAFCFSGWLFSQSPLEVLVDADFEAVSIETVLESLKKHPDIIISYSPELSNLKRKVRCQEAQVPLKTVLTKILNNTDLSFKEIGKQVVIFKDLTIKVKKRQTIYGYIEDSTTGERLIGANIFPDDNYLQGTTSNRFGFFSLSIPSGIQSLRIQYLGYEDYTIKQTLEDGKIITIKLIPFKTELGSVTITGKRFSPDNIEPITEIDKAALELMPALGGETDLMRVINFQPGVQTGAEGIGGTHVRGGGADQNLILLDDAPVYNPAHTWGIYSIFDHNAVQNIRFYSHGFPSRYGGRLSSIIDVRTKDGNKLEYEKKFEIGLLSSKFSLEGPIIKNKASFFISGRGSLTGLYSRAYYANRRSIDGNNGTINYWFYDINSKINYSPNSKNRFHLSFYSGADIFRDDIGEDIFSADTSVLFKAQFDRSYNQRWGNNIGSFRWNRTVSKKLFANFTMTYSKFENETKEDRDVIIRKNEEIIEIQSNRQQFNSNIEDRTVKLDFDYYNNSNATTRFGIQAKQFRFQPGIVDIFSDNIDVNIDRDTFQRALDTLWEQGEIQTNQVSAYFGYDQNFLKKGNFRIGGFGTQYHVEDTSYLAFEPRIGVSWQANEEAATGVNFESMTQFLHLLSPYTIGLPEDIWVTSTKSIRPQRSYQISYWQSFKLKSGTQFGISAYYKKMWNLIDVKDVLVYRFNANDWEDVTTVGKGLAYGMEWNFSKKWGGWLQTDINYTYAKSKREFEELNFNGAEFPYRYDRRHSANVLAVGKINKRLTLSAAFSFGTGLAITQPIGDFIITPVNFPPINIRRFDTRNGARMPFYHKLDLGGDYKWIGTIGEQQIKFSVHNIYLRKNAIFYELRRDENEQGEIDEIIHKRFILPLLPAFSYSVKF